MNYTPIPFDFLEEMEELSDAEYGRLVRWGQHYHLTGEKSKLCGNERFYSKRMQMQIDRYVENYNGRIEKCRKAGQASADARQRPSTDVNDCQRPLTDVNEINQTETETETKTNTETKIYSPDGENGKTRKTRFTPPTLQEVTEYVREKGYHFEPAAFFGYYDSQNWKKANGQKVTNWRQCCVTWEQRERDNPKKPAQQSCWDPSDRDDSKTMEQIKRLHAKMMGNEKTADPRTSSGTE